MREERKRRAENLVFYSRGFALDSRLNQDAAFAAEVWAPTERRPVCFSIGTCSLSSLRVRIFIRDMEKGGCESDLTIDLENRHNKHLAQS
jgi:hypothetical protein